MMIEPPAMCMGIASPLLQHSVCRIHLQERDLDDQLLTLLDLVVLRVYDGE